jgi:hypothetical protein
MASYVRATQRYLVEPGGSAHYAQGSGAIRNLSLGGVYIEDHNHCFESGQELTLELRLAREVIAVRGLVCHCRAQAGFGFRFVEFPGDSKARLVDYFRMHFGRSD